MPFPVRGYQRRGLRTAPGVRLPRTKYRGRKARIHKSNVSKKMSMVHYHKRKADNSHEKIITLSGSTSSSPYLDVLSSVRFQLDYVQNYTDLSTLYDKYAISAVKIKYYWSPSIASHDNDVVGGDGLLNIYNISDTFAPMMRYHIDYDDDSTPNWDAMGADSRTKQVRILPNKPVSIYIKPKVLQMVYTTAVSTGYSAKRLKSVDTQNPDVPHYGLKTVIRYPNISKSETSAAGDNLGQIYTETTYYLTMKFPQT